MSISHRLSTGGKARRALPGLQCMHHEGSEELSFDVAEVEVIRDFALTAGDADREPVETNGEVRLALCEGAEGVGSGEFRYGGDRLCNRRLYDAGNKPGARRCRSVRAPASGGWRVLLNFPRSRPSRHPFLF